MAKSRSYKVQDQLGVPCLTIKGKFLQKEFGIEAGQRLELMEEENLMILRKVPAADLQHQEHLERLKRAEKEVAHLRSRVNQFEGSVSPC